MRYLIAIVAVLILAFGVVAKNDNEQTTGTFKPVVLVDANGETAVANSEISRLTTEYLKAKENGNEKRARYFLSWISVQRDLLAMK